MAENNLREGLFRFAMDLIKMLRSLKGGSDLLVINPQLIKSVTSSGANYEEAQGVVSRADFSCKVGTSL
jgi:four helix bundle protein